MISTPYNTAGLRCSIAGPPSLFTPRFPVLLWREVKEPLKAPFIFLFILICTTAVLSALNIIYTWGMIDSASRGFSLAYAAQRLPRSVFDVLIPSVVLSIVLLGFRLARHPFSRFLGLLIVLGVSYIVLVNGMLWLRAFSAKVPATAAVPRQYLQPSTFIRLGDSEIALQIHLGQGRAGHPAVRRARPGEAPAGIPDGHRGDAGRNADHDDGQQATPDDHRHRRSLPGPRSSPRIASRVSSCGT